MSSETTLLQGHMVEIPFSAERDIFRRGRSIGTEEDWWLPGLARERS